MLDIATSNSNNNQFSSNLKADDGKRSKPDINMHITLALLNKIIESIEDFYDIYIKNKYIKIVKHKVITSIVKKIKEIYTNLWDLYDLPSIPRKSYVSLLLDKYT